MNMAKEVQLTTEKALCEKITGYSVALVDAITGVREQDAGILAQKFASSSDRDRALLKQRGVLSQIED